MNLFRFAAVTAAHGSTADSGALQIAHTLIRNKFESNVFLLLNNYMLLCVGIYII